MSIAGKTLTPTETRKVIQKQFGYFLHKIKIRPKQDGPSLVKNHHWIGLRHVNSIRHDIEMTYLRS